MRKPKYWVKMKIFEGTFSWIMKCEHIGEAKLFGYILGTFNQNDLSWSMNKHKLEAIKDLIGVEETTVYSYLKSLTKNKLLIKISRGNYAVNEEYIEYGNFKK